MPARQSAGNMIRSVSYAANIVGGTALQLSYTAIWPSHSTVFGEEFPDDSRKTPLTLDVPLASASSYHTIDMKRIFRAFTRQTKMREPQRQLATGIHPCWRSLTILTPVIPRPRQGSTGRRAAAEAPGRNSGLQRGTLKRNFFLLYAPWTRTTHQQFHAGRPIGNCVHCWAHPSHG